MEEFKLSASVKAHDDDVSPGPLSQHSVHAHTH